MPCWWRYVEWVRVRRPEALTLAPMALWWPSGTIKLRIHALTPWRSLNGARSAGRLAWVQVRVSAKRVRVRVRV